MKLSGLELAPPLIAAAIGAHVAQGGRGALLAALVALLALLVALKRSSDLRT